MIHIGRRDLVVFAQELFGKSPAVRDLAALDSALARARNASSFGEGSPFVVASYYADGIVRSHPFVDGNKRMGWGATAMFLAVNGLDVKTTTFRLVELVVSLADGTTTREYFAGFLDAASSPRSGGAEEKKTA